MNKTTIFTKPWKNESLPRLAELVKELGFDGVELPVREGYQVEPAAIGKKLPEAAAAFAARGLTIESAAAELDEPTIRALGDCGVPILRVMAPVDPKAGYWQSEKKLKERIRGLAPLLERCGVTVGVQNHKGNFIGSAMGLVHLLEDIDPRIAAPVFDPAHCSVAGEPLELAWDIMRGRLRLLNMKSAYRRHTGWPENEFSEAEMIWSTAQYSEFSWRRMVELMKQSAYDGPVCLTCEYSARGGGALAGSDVLPLIRKDLEFYKRCWS